MVFTSASAADRLARAHEFLDALPPLTESIIVSGSREAADDFVRRHTIARGSTFGLHRFGATGLVARLAANELARRGLAPLTALGAQALAAQAAFEALNARELKYFAPVAASRGFPACLAATLTDFRLARADADLLSGDDASLGDIQILLRRYEQLLTSGRLADYAELLKLASAAIEQDRSAFPVGRAVLFIDVAIDTEAFRRFAVATLRAASHAFVTVSEGDIRSLAALRSVSDRWSRGSLDPRTGQAPRAAANSSSRLARLREYLFVPGSETTAPADGSVKFFSAPGEGRECVEIARFVLEEARRGVAFDKMAVALRRPDLYTPLLRAALNRAQVPAWFSHGTSVPDPSGRAFLALLACAEERLSARRFAEYLSLGQVPDLDRDGAPPPREAPWTNATDPDRVFSELTRAEPTESAIPEPPDDAPAPRDDDDAPVIEGTLKTPWRWERVLVESAVIGGRERWRKRLDGLATEWHVALSEARREDPDSSRSRKLERDLTDLNHLRRFALPVIELLAELPTRATWSEFLTQLDALAPRVLRKPERVLEVLRELRPMGAIGPIALADVRRVLDERLRLLRDEPARRRYGRVLVCTVDELRGRAVDVLFVPGVAERLFPQRQREDPLLLDDRRSTLNRRLQQSDGFNAFVTNDDRVAEERLRLQLVAGAAAERIYFSYPRMEVTESRSRVPSFYALEVERAQTGRIPEPDKFQRDAEEVVRARLGWPAPTDPAMAIDDAEHDLAVLGHLRHKSEAESRGRARYLLDLNEALGRSLRSRWLRWSTRKWSGADGLYAPGEVARAALDRQSLKHRPYSVSALQKFAICPYQFFLSAILRLQPREEIVQLERLDPLTRGSLVHRLQAELTREVISSGSAPDRSRLDKRFEEIVDAIEADERERLAPAIDRVWREEIDAIRGDLREWFGRLIDALPDWRPLFVEYGFGFPPTDGRDPASRPEPVTLPDGSLLHGVVDLIEGNRSDLLRITDHKTGSNRTTEGLVVGGGETLQPVLYGLAMEARLGKTVAEGRLSFCTSRGGFTERTIRLGLDERQRGLDVLAIIDRAITDGTLIPAPKQRACTWCDFREVCGPNEEARSRRYKDPAPLGDIDALRELK